MVKKMGWYGDSAVNCPIHAPLTPRLNKSSGTTQQADAATAPNIPPAATSMVLVASGAASLSGPGAPSATVLSTFFMFFLAFIAFILYPTICSYYRCKKNQHVGDHNKERLYDLSLIHISE